jgi:DNA-binding NtrC family response regulator
LPEVVRPGARPAIEAAGAGRDAGIRRVLIIDDEPMVRQTLGKMLSRAGIEARMAEGGRQGLALYADEWRNIDCVILDLNMPDLGGGETLVALREINPRASVLLSSGCPEDQVLQRLKERPNGMLVKPFRASRLLEALYQLPRPGAD